MEEVASFFGDSVNTSPLLQSNTYSLVPSKLTIVKHKAHSEEIVSKNGLQHPLHIIVKNSPYHLQIGGLSGQKVDFTKIAFEAFLLYDTDGLKEVDYVKVKPMDFKSSPIENGRYLDVELRIKVLTSQHEDMLFKVRIQGYNPISRDEIPGMTLLTPSIKVISKPEQLKKKQPSKKRSLTDMLVETVSRIEKKQEEQQRLIERMMHQQTEQASTIDKKQKVEDLPWGTLPELHVGGEKNDNKQLVDFEDAFVNLIKAYSGMQSQDKSETIRRVIRNSSSKETERLSEIIDLFWTEGLRKEPSFVKKSQGHKISTSILHQDGCSCVECPHKQELERIDEFYKEFLSSGVGISMTGY